jgi:Fic family protein
VGAANIPLISAKNAANKLQMRLLSGFEGKLTTQKWAKMTDCSQDTALRDVESLIEQGILKKEPAGGRSTHCQLIVM